MGERCLTFRPQYLPPRYLPPYSVPTPTRYSHAQQDHQLRSVSFTGHVAHSGAGGEGEAAATGIAIAGGDAGPVVIFDDLVGDDLAGDLDQRVGKLQKSPVVPTPVKPRSAAAPEKVPGHSTPEGQ